MVPIRQFIASRHLDRYMPRTFIAASLAVFMALPLSSAASSREIAPKYKVAASVSLGTPDRWDYVVFDSDLDRVYVAHGDQLSVVDDKTATLVGTVGPINGGTHGTAISLATRTGYTDDGKAGVAVPFNISTLKAEPPVHTAPDADGILFDSVSRHIFVINGDSGSISVIDPIKNSVVSTISVGAGLEAGTMDGRGGFFIDGAERHDILRINTATNTVEAEWPMPSCERPHGIAMDRQTRRIFATCSNKVMVVMDADTGKILASLPIGAYSDGAAFDPVRKLAFSSNGEGSLSVIKEEDPDTFVALQPIKTVPSARTMDIDPKTGRIFLAAADIAKVDPPTIPGGRPHVSYVPGSLKLIFLDPQF